MAKLTRITGKTFGETADPTDNEQLGPEIGQFGSALAGTYNGTSDVATIQSLSAWSEGFIGAVTPQNQYPPLPEMTGALKVLSYQENYILQQGVPEWDSATDYYINNFCSYSGVIYKSLSNNNLDNRPDISTANWEVYGAVTDYANKDLQNLTTLGNSRLQFAPFAINQGVVDNGKNATLSLNSEPVYYKRSVNIVGSLTITDNTKLSAFSSSNYATLFSSFIAAQVGATSFEMKLNFITSNVITSNRDVFAEGSWSPTSSAEAGLIIRQNSSGYFEVCWDCSSSTSTQYTWGSSALSSLAPNTEYETKIIATKNSNTSMSVEVLLKKVSDNDWVSLGTKNCAFLETSSYSGTAYLGINRNLGGIWDGLINLENSYIKINDNYWWQGVIEGTSSDYDWVVSTGTEISCAPCTITTCDSRTIIFDSSSIYEISNEADGDYYIFKNCNTGNISLHSSFEISKTVPIKDTHWIQPTLSADGTLGGDSFAVSASSEYSSSYPAWKAFDNNNSNEWHANSTGTSPNLPQSLIIYNPNALNVTNIKITNRKEVATYATAGNIYGSNDNSTYTLISAFTNTTGTTALAEWNIDLSSNANYYKYYKIEFTNVTYSSSSHSFGITQVDLTATEGHALENGDLWLDTSTIPANLKEYSSATQTWSINNDLVYIGNCTVSSGAVTSLTNRKFNDPGYLIDRYIPIYECSPDYDNAIVISASGYIAPLDGYILVKNIRVLPQDEYGYINGNEIWHTYTSTSVGIYTPGALYLVVKGDKFTYTNTEVNALFLSLKGN